MPPLLYAERAAMKELTDESLLSAVASGDEKAGNEIFARHYPRAHRIAFRVTRDATLAEDCAQEALARILARAAQYVPLGSFQGYVYRVVVNEAKNALKLRARRARHEETAARKRAPHADFAGDAALVAEEVNAAVSELEDDLRIPILLHYYEGLTQAQVAEALEVPAGTAASRLRRGLERLEAQLAAVGAGALTIAVIEETLRASGRSPTPAPRSAALGRAGRVARPLSAARLALLGGTAAVLLGGIATALVVSEERRDASVEVSAVEPGAGVSVVGTTGRAFPVVPPVTPRAPLPASNDAKTAAAPSAARGPFLASGVVLRGKEEPAAGMSVKVEVGETAYVATSDTTGHFEVAGTPSGKADELVWVEARDPARRLLGARTLVSEGSSRVRLRLEPGALVAVRVLDARSQAPLAGVKLSVDKVGFAVGSLLVVEDDAGVSGADGTFTLGPLREGEQRVVARAAGFAPSRTKALELEAGKTASVALEMSEGLSLAGRVVDPAGNPLANAVLGIYLGSPREGLVTPESWVEQHCSGQSLEKVLGTSLDSPGEEEKKGSLLGEDAVFATSGADGSFAFEHLPRGKRQLICVHARFATSRTFVKPTKEDAPLALRLEAGGEVHGFARNADGTLARGALAVVMSPEAGGRFGLVDEAGRFSVPGLESGSYMLLLARPGVKAIPDMKKMRMVEVAAPASVHCDIGPAPDGARVVGRALKGSEPVTLGGATLERLEGEKSTLVALLDDGGRFTFEGVPAGRYVLRAQEALGGAPHSLAVSVPEGGGEVTADIDLLLGAIAGRVDGAGKGGIAVATSVASGEEHVGVVWPDGSFAIDGLGAGEYRVRAARGGVGTGSSGTVTVAAAARVEGVTLSAGSGAPLEVLVEDRDGDPCAGAHAVLAPHGEPPVLAAGLLQDASGVEPGVVKLGSVPDGRFDVWAFADGRAVGVARDVAIGSGRVPVPVQVAAASSLRVAVNDAAGKPVPGAVLSLRDVDGGWVFASPQGAGEGALGPTKEDGTARAGALPPGSLVLEARARDGRVATVTLVLEAGRETTAAVVLP